MDIEFKGGVLRPYSSPARGDSPFERHCVSNPDIGFHCDILLHGSVSLAEETHDDQAFPDEAVVPPP